MLAFAVAEFDVQRLDLLRATSKDCGIVELRRTSGFSFHGGIGMVGLVDLAEEFRSCEFGDARLTTRAMEMANVLSSKPNLSIPAAFRTKADIDGCYRFFDNEKVTPDKILSTHIEETVERIRQVDYVLLVQDTTEIDLTRPKQQLKFVDLWTAIIACQQLLK